MSFLGYRRRKKERRVESEAGGRPYGGLITIAIPLWQWDPAVCAQYNQIGLEVSLIVMVNVMF